MSSDSLPEIFPDYSGVTVPANIAPLNFMVEDAEAVQAVFSVKGAEIAAIVGREGVVSVPFKKWAQILSFGKGEAVSVEVSVWNSEFPDGVRYRPFQINPRPSWPRR